jgi:FAD:protein FMN transferase
MPTVCLARNCMGTRFELVLHGKNSASCRAAGEEALDEIEFWEYRLSLFLPTSDISKINRTASGKPIRIDPRVFSVLVRARKLWEITEGSFDPMVGPLMQCWGLHQKEGRAPTEAKLKASLDKSGMRHLQLEEETYSATVHVDGGMLDLGSFGKGIAVDEAVKTLLESGVEAFLLHGGTSTVFAWNESPGEMWKVAIPGPPTEGRSDTVLKTEFLNGNALSLSAIWGKTVKAGKKEIGHVLDPRTGQPVSNRLMAYIILPSAAETDALSTALLVLGQKGIGLLCRHWPGIRGGLLTGSGPDSLQFLEFPGEMKP